MGTGVSVFQAATLQCAALASPEFLQEFQGGLSDRLGVASDSAWVYRDGAFRLPDRPGLGVSVDEAGIEKFAVRR
jgi:L-alanine-DL-glutamate epimerase-like enolase superfamily enzyme